MPISVNELIRTRWSPRAFLDRPIEGDKLRALFEAARWAASSYNEQPWRFVVATKDNPAEFDRVLKLLMEQNQQWAKTAWLIGFSAGKKTFTVNGAPDRFGLHDTGAASATLALEATEIGLHAHFMGGFDASRARSEFGVPENFDIGAAFAVGYIDEAGTPAPARTRKPLPELVFTGNWASAAPFVSE
jgi:nitroreductase